MKRLACLSVIVLAVLILLPLELLCAQTQAKKPGPAPQVPITYVGDTHDTVIRRAQWMESAKKEGALVWWGILNPNEARKIITEFNKVYPWINVEYWRGEGEEIAAKLESGHAGGRTIVDVCLGGQTKNYPRWAKMGVLERFTSIVPGIEKFDSRMYGKRGDWYMPAIAPKIPQYNTAMLSSAEAPKSWEDLLDPKWKEQVGVVTESADWAVLAIAEGGWGVEKAENFLTKLKGQKPKFISGVSAAHSLLIAGEFKVTAMGNLRHVIISQKKKAPVDWVRAKPVIAKGPCLILSKKAPHPNAARLFLEWALSPQGRLPWSDVTENYIPGVANQITKLLDGMPFVVATEEVELKVADLDLIKKFNKLLFGMED